MLVDISAFFADGDPFVVDDPFIVKIMDDFSNPLYELAFESPSSIFTVSNDITVDPRETIGDAGDSIYWQKQEREDTCALVAAGSIIAAMTEQVIPEEELVQEATARGYFYNGTAPEDVGKILEVYGVDYHTQKNGTTADIVRELVQGHKVIVLIDSGELLRGLLYETVEFIEEKVFRVEAADHAIWIIGVDLSDPDDIRVIINDSGVDDGAGKSISLSDFVDAWEDSGFHYVATTEPPADLDQHVSDFDAETKTFPAVIDYFSENVEGFNAAEFLHGDLSADDSQPYVMGTNPIFDDLLEKDPHLIGFTSIGTGKAIKALIELLIELSERAFKHAPDLWQATRNVLSDLTKDVAQEYQLRGAGAATRVLIRGIRHFHEDIETAIEKIRQEKEVDGTASDIYIQSVTDATVADTIAAIAEEKPMFVMMETGDDASHIASVNLDDPTNPQIVVSTPDQVEQLYSIDGFRAAWEDAKFHYVTIEAIESPEIALFDSLLSASESEFAIEEMPVDQRSLKFLITQAAYGFNNVDDWIRYKAEEWGVSFEQARQLLYLEFKGNVASWPSPFASNKTLQAIKQLILEDYPFHKMWIEGDPGAALLWKPYSSPHKFMMQKAHNYWFQTTFGDISTVGELRDSLAQHGFNLEIGTDASNGKLASVLESEGLVIGLVDREELEWSNFDQKLSDERAQAHYYGKFRSSLPAAFKWIEEIVRMTQWSYEMKKVAFNEEHDTDDGPATPRDFVIVTEFGENEVTVILNKYIADRSTGYLLQLQNVERTYSREEFDQAFEDFGFTYITIEKTVPEGSQTQSLTGQSNTDSGRTSNVLEPHTGSIDEIVAHIQHRAAVAATGDDFTTILGDLEENVDPAVLNSPEVREALAECIPWVHLWTYQGFYKHGDVICAVVAQKIILEAFGIDIPVDTLVQEAIHNKTLDDGMFWNDIGKILEQRGINFEKHRDLSAADIEKALSENRMVLLPLDAPELWAGDTFIEKLSTQTQDIIVSIAKTAFNSLSPEDQAEVEKQIGGQFVLTNHVLIASKIDRSDPDNPMIILIDSGDLFGGGKAYPLEKFMDAWKDGDYRALITSPAPEPMCLLESQETNMPP